MSRRVVLVLVLAIVVVVVGAAAATVVSARGSLDDDRETVDARWAVLRAPLTARYAGLAQVADALANGSGADRTYTVDLQEELATWDRLAEPGRADPGAEADSANRLEGLAERVRVNVAQSARLNRDEGIAAGLSAFDTALVPADDVDAYNRAVRSYQSTRTDTLKRVPAELLGFDARPILVIGTGPSG